MSIAGRCLTVALGALFFMGCAQNKAITTPSETGAGLSTGWKSHDMSRPQPNTINPAKQPLPVAPPQGAVMLFDGDDLNGWISGRDEPARWTVENGYFQAAPGTGPLRTKATFGDVQLHVEWATPSPAHGEGQDRANSGVFLMGRYEIQVLDSYRAATYADGQAGAMYGQYPPLFNAALAPGEWQSYDIFFRRPRFAADGTLLEPARVTVLHNGVLIQNNEAFVGPTSWLKPFQYEMHPDAGPIELQDHGHPVKYRNIWALPLPERARNTAAPAARADVDTATLNRLTGTYNQDGNASVFAKITRVGNNLAADFTWRNGTLIAVPVSATEYALTDTDARLVFDVDASGQVRGLVFKIGGSDIRAVKVQ